MDNRQTLDQHNFRIGVFDIEPARNLVSKNDEVHSLEPRIMDVLCVLASEPGEVLTRDSLIERVWHVEYGADESLTRAIGVLRKTFRDAGEDAEYIETIPKRGYRLTQAVTTLEAPLPHAVPMTGNPDDRGRKGLFAGLAAAALIIAAFAGYFALSPDNKPTPAETNANLGADESEVISIAVLPFDDFSEAKDQEYFANGISEELLNVLARVDGLRVASRTSAFTFKDHEAKIGEIADVLNVGHILVGSVRKSGTTLRISAQLIDTSNDQQVWSQTYDRPLSAENLFEIQDTIAHAIVGELKGELPIDATFESSRPTSLEAYELYMRSRYQSNKRLPDPLRASVVGFKQAIELDPEFAPAYSALGETYIFLWAYAGADRTEMNEMAAPYLARALELAPDSAEVLTSAAANEPNLEKAILLAERAIAANANYAPAYHRSGRLLITAGRHEQALATLQKGRALDPLSAIILTNIFTLQKDMGAREAALRTAKDNMKLNPHAPFGYIQVATLKIDEGDYQGAHAMLKDAQVLNPIDTATTRLLSSIYTQVGLFDHALAVANRRPEERAFALIASGDAEAARKIANTEAYETGQIYYRLGDFSKAYPTLRRLADRLNLIDRLIDRRKAALLAAVTEVYQREGDAQADHMLAKLAELTEGKDPSEFSLPHHFTTSGNLEFLRGNFETGIKMYARAADLGLAEAGAEFMRFPGVDEIRHKPEWKLVEKQLKENAARHRAAIEAQLANPKPNWITP
jgi:TolB-like protein/DNA-binding winged helix-turn-helix (wHTH) protein/Flp pilus assembly protein TadD